MLPVENITKKDVPGHECPPPDFAEQVLGNRSRHYPLALPGVDARRPVVPAANQLQLP